MDPMMIRRRLQATVEIALSQPTQTYLIGTVNNVMYWEVEVPFSLAMHALIP